MNTMKGVFSGITFFSFLTAGTLAFAQHYGDFADGGCEGTKRKYSAILWDIEGKWEKACKEHVAKRWGRAADRCENNTLNMWGVFLVADPRCGSVAPPAISNNNNLLQDIRTALVDAPTGSPTYVELPHVTLGVFGGGVSGLVKDHVNGIAVWDDEFSLSYPGYPDTTAYVLSTTIDGDWSVREIDIGAAGYPSGMQRHSGYLVVGLRTHSNTNQSLVVLNMFDRPVSEAARISAQSGQSVEFVGFTRSKEPTNATWFAISKTTLWRGQQPQFLRSVDLSQELCPSVEGGISLLPTDGADQLVAICLGVHNDGFAYEAYGIDASTIPTGVVRIENGTLEIPFGHQWDWASFRWGGTAIIRGNALEFYAAPRRIDGVGNYSALLKWTVDFRSEE